MMDEDLNGFFDGNDFAVRAVFADKSASVLFDAPDDIEIGGAVLSRNYAITYPAGQLEGLADGDAIIVDGKAYTARGEPRAIEDGALMRAILSLD